MVKNGNFTFLLLELILVDLVADLPLPTVVASNGQEWQYEISTVRAHIGRSTGRCTPIEACSGWEWQFQITTVRAHIGRSKSPQVQASSGQEWQYEISTIRTHIGRSPGKSTPHRSM